MLNKDTALQFLMNVWTVTSVIVTTLVNLSIQVKVSVLVSVLYVKRYLKKKIEFRHLNALRSCLKVPASAKPNVDDRESVQTKVCVF